VDGGYRWNVTARCLLAFVGASLWVSLLGACIARLLVVAGWMTTPESVHWMTMLSFAGWCALAAWIFYHASLKAVGMWMLGSGMALGGLFFLVGSV